MSRPRPRTSATSGSPAIAAAQLAARAAAFSTSPARSISPSTAFAVAVASGLPPKVLPCWPAVSRSDAAPKVMSAPIGNAAADALRDRDRVGHDAVLLEREPGARAAGPGLDLVEDEQRTVALP